MISAGARTLPRAAIYRWLAAFLLAFGGLLVVAAYPPAAGARPLTTGITNIEDEVPLGFARTRETGAQFVRIPLYWGAIAPRVRPSEWRPDDPFDSNYHWERSDDAVVNAVAAGLTPVLQVD